MVLSNPEPGAGGSFDLNVSWGADEDPDSFQVLVAFGGDDNDWFFLDPVAGSERSVDFNVPAEFGGQTGFVRVAAVTSEGVGTAVQSNSVVLD